MIRTKNEPSEILVPRGGGPVQFNFFLTKKSLWVTKVNVKAWSESNSSITLFTKNTASKDIGLQTLLGPIDKHVLKKTKTKTKTKRSNIRFHQYASYYVIFTILSVI